MKGISNLIQHNAKRIEKQNISLAKKDRQKMQIEQNNDHTQINIIS